MVPCLRIEVKLNELNFKVIHGICHAIINNLKKWRIKERDSCDISNSKQTIEHLLFECHRVTKLWHIVEDAYCQAITNLPDRD